MPTENLFDTVHNCFKRYVQVQPHEHVAFTLWGFHAHVFNQFQHTPRLAVLGPIQEVGKSTVFQILNELVPRPRFWIDPTPATLFRVIEEKPTLLIDEADHMRINKQILQVLNNGYEVNGTVPRWDPAEQKVRDFPVFGPLGIAGIGKKLLPPTLKSRCIVTFVHHYDRSLPKPTRFDKTNAALMVKMWETKQEIVKWAKEVNLNTDPELPKGWSDIDRRSHNWRVLIAIADSLGRGDIARQAAMAFEALPPHPYQKLFIEFFKLFKEYGSVIPSDDVVKYLLNLDNPEYDWSRFSKNQPINQHTLGDVLNDEFGIQTKQMWVPIGAHRNLQKKRRCYIEEDFELRFRQYIPKQGAGSGTSGTIVQEFKPRKKR